MNTNSSQPAAGTPCPGATNVILYYYTFNITVGNPSFTRILNFTTSGTYAAADIVNLKLYMTNFEAFNTSNLISTIAVGLGPGAHTFGPFANPLPTGVVQRYFWVTADIAAGAVAGRTLRCNIITAAMITITGTLNYGTNNAAGIQTICALPIELYSFTGRNSEEKNILEWTTASEMNNDYFTVEKSENGISYSELIRINGAGNSSTNKYYSTNDIEPYPNLTYYRLKQTDFNGDFTYSNIISVSSEEDVVYLYPTPSHDNFDVKLFSTEDGIGFLDIFDLVGQKVLSQSFPKSKGTNNINVNASSLAQGVYTLYINNTSRKKQLRFVKI